MSQNTPRPTGLATRDSSPPRPRQKYGAASALEGSITQAKQQNKHAGSNDCVEDVGLEISSAPLTPYYFGESQALKLEIPPYPEDPVQMQPATAPPFTTGGFSWETIPSGAEVSPRGMLGTLNHSFTTGGSIMPEVMNHVGAGYFTPVSPNDFSDVESSSPMPVDLDQLYWERVHHFAPIIHQRRYFSWSRRPDKSAAQVALQYSMWTLAASAGTDYDQLSVDRLHRCASQALQVIENTDDPTAVKQSSDLERVQAQLLLSMYEFKHIDFRQGWLTAGCAFRLIQLGWFQDLISGLNLLPASMEWTELEEKRRTFWLAFYLDRIISLRSDSPCTFGEEDLIPLPVPDANFQNGVPTITAYLADNLDNGDYASDGESSEFTESIKLANLSVTRLHIQAEETEPGLLFQSIMWRTVILYMYQTMNSALALADEKHPALEYYQEASIAAQHLVVLTDKLLQVNCSKMHPLSLIPLNMCGILLETWPELADSFSNHFRSMTEAMRGLVDV
ncbi:hypothetical protein diail_12360 [Diaporthe ilicicola]|nr:hypothetical protein diail_12360 [Diaporthe ilicicola]